MRMLAILLLAVFCRTTIAATLCIGSCPTETPPPDYSGTLNEFFIGGNGYLSLEIGGRLYLDKAIYDTHVTNFTSFSSDSEILFDPLPSEYPFPSYTDFTSVGFGAATVVDITLPSDVLIRNMEFGGEIRIHAAGDILVTDTSNLIPTPVPSSLLLFLSGAFVLRVRTFWRRKSNKVLQLTRYSALFQRADIFTFPKRAVTSS